MAPKATQRSSQSARGSASQPASQRNGRRRVEEDEDDENDDEQDYEEDGSDNEEMANASQAPARGSQGKAKGKKSTGAAASMNPDDLRRRAHDLVRMALFEEPKRGALKRPDINKKVLGDASRAFPVVFEAAQKILRKTFGMELVELMTRSERDAIGEEPEKKDAPKKKVTATSKTYVLRSILDPRIITAASEPNNELLEKETLGLQEMGLVGEDLDNMDEALRPQGRLLWWQQTEPIAITGILHLILCLILVNGRGLPEARLKNQLKPFHLQFTSKFAAPAFSTESDKHGNALRVYLQSLVKQNYLDCVLMPTPGSTAATQGGSRRKSRVAADDDEGDFEWKWGTRAHAEIGEEAVARWMRDFMAERWLAEQRRLLEEDDADEDPDARRRNQRSLQDRLDELVTKSDKVAQNVYKDIVRAAGGNLTDIPKHRVEPVEED